MTRRLKRRSQRLKAVSIQRDHLRQQTAELHAAQLHAGDRAWMSIEILGSLFGRFKQMEGQHSKDGFTQLITAIQTQ